MAKFIMADGPWGWTPGRRKPMPWELPEWQMVEPEDRLFERLDPREDELCQVRQAIEAARERPMGFPNVAVDSLPRMNDLSSPDMLGLIENARAVGASAFRLVDPEGDEMKFRL